MYKRKLDELFTSTSKCVPTETVPFTTPKIARILSWNIETPVPFLGFPFEVLGSFKTLNPSRSKYLREMLARYEFPDFVCLQEVRARQGDTEWVAALNNAINGHDSGPAYTLYTSLNRRTCDQRHFGTATLAKYPEAIAAAREVDWDSEGRVIILEMKAGWALVKVYALNGSEYLWKDPTRKGLPKTRNERKRESNRFLLRECQAMRERGLRLVLIGDFNISLTNADCYPRLRMEYPHTLARKEFNEKFIPEANLVDVLRHMHGDKRGFSWFAKGKPRVRIVQESIMPSLIVSRVLNTWSTQAKRRIVTTLLCYLNFVIWTI